MKALYGEGSADYNQALADFNAGFNDKLAQQFSAFDQAIKERYNDKPKEDLFGRALAVVDEEVEELDNDIANAINGIDLNIDERRPLIPQNDDASAFFKGRNANNNPIDNLDALRDDLSARGPRAGNDNVQQNSLQNNHP